MATLPDGTLALRRLSAQLERSQWAPAEDLAASQFRHLGRLAAHCARRSPSFAARLTRAGLQPHDLAEPSRLAMLPPLTRRDVQMLGGDLHCDAVPSGHGRVGHTRTSGSTGEPVVVHTTGVTMLFWEAMAMRQLQWHGADLSGRLCSIRANVSARIVHDDWGSPATAFGSTGPMLLLPVATDAAQLVEAVAAFRATTLVILPGALDAFTVYCRRHAVTLPDLRQVLTISETLSPSLRALVAETFGVGVFDCYSSQELGYIAIECPVSGHYHVMAESVIAEVLNEDGAPCGPGGIGRVVLTSLHNYATPLVRYDIGDYAEVAPPCPCGRGLPTWKRILGRERHLMVRPDGTRHWPVTGFIACRDLAPVLQFQLVQEDHDSIEARLVVERALTSQEEQELRALFQRAAGYPYRMRLSYVAGRIPPGPSGKYEEFVCHVPAADGAGCASASV